MTFEHYSDLSRSPDPRAEMDIQRWHEELITHAERRRYNRPYPTLQDVVKGYLDVGMTKRQALRYIFDDRMRANVARGKGYKAARRATEAFRRVGKDIDALQQRIARNRAQWAADAAAERCSEGRTLGDRHVNFHE